MVTCSWEVWYFDSYVGWRHYFTNRDNWDSRTSLILPPFRCLYQSSKWVVIYQCVSYRKINVASFVYDLSITSRKCFGRVVIFVFQFIAFSYNYKSKYQNTWLSVCIFARNIVIWKYKLWTYSFFSTLKNTLFLDLISYHFNIARMQ